MPDTILYDLLTVLSPEKKNTKLLISHGQSRNYSKTGHSIHNSLQHRM